MPSKSRACRPVLMLCLLSALLFVKGLYLGGLQYVIGNISASFGMEIAGIGILVALPHVTSIVLPTAMGTLSDKIGKKLVLVLCCGGFALGCVLVCLSKGIVLYIIGSLIVGGSGSACESLATAVLADVNPKDSARYINISQCVLSAGAVISPVGIRWLMDITRLNWRLLFALCGFGAALLIGLLLISAFPVSAPKTMRKRGGEKLPFFRNGIFLCAILSMVLYISLENGVGYFAESFFTHTLSREELGAYALSLYWIGNTVSRLVFSVRMKNLRSLLLIHFGATAVLFGALTFSASPYLCLALCGSIGFAYGPIWSALVALATRQFPEHSGSVSGLMMSAGAIGNTATPVLMGIISGWFSIRAGFLLMTIFAIAGALLAMVSKKHKDSRKTV